MFLIRAAFGLAVVVMLLPADEAQQAKVTGQAGSVVERAASFCERNVNTCAAGAELWATFLKKAEFGAKLAGNMIQDYMKGGAQSREHGQLSSAPNRQLPFEAPLQPAPARSIEPSRGTLAPGDLAPAWRGRITRTGA